MRRVRVLVVLIFSLASASVADTVIFTETCASSPVQYLPSSTTVTVGTAWGSRVTLVGSPTKQINSGTTSCTVETGELNLGFGYVASPNPTTNTYYADFQWIDLGNVSATAAIGFLVNYIDASNYYACLILDDTTSGVTKIVKVAGGSGSTLATGTQGTVPANDVIECRIDYSGASPVITFTNATDVVQFLTATDSSSPLTKTKKAGVMMGATPQASTDDTNQNVAFDTFRVSTVPDGGGPTAQPRPPWFGRAF